MRTPDKQLLPLIAASVLLAQGVSIESAFAVAKWGQPGVRNTFLAAADVPKPADVLVSDDSTSPVWDELSRMSSGFKRRNLMAGSQTEGDAGKSIADSATADSTASEGEKAGGSADDAKAADAKASGDDAKAGGDAKADEDARASDDAKASDAKTEAKAAPGGDKSSDAGTSAGVVSSLKGLTPTESYMKCREAMLKAKSISEVIPYLSKSSGAEASSDLAKNPEDAKSKLELLQLIMPPQVKVTGEKITGSTAVLTAIPLAPSQMDEGMSQLMNGMAQGLAKAMGNDVKMPPTKTETQGSIYMTLEDGVWKQDKEKWNSQVKEASGNQ